jgi:uncharacterized SAM-binding protein YcdF (DUF218 family)
LTRVVAVLGYSRTGDRGLHPICAHRVAHAERIAGGARAVVLSGWARRHAPAGEADLMRAAWRRDDVPVVLDRSAQTTAGNAAAVARLARSLGAAELVVVTSRWHARRARALVRAALRGSGIRVSVSSPGDPPAPLLALRELACATAVPVQSRRLRRNVTPVPTGTPRGDSAL